MKQFATQLRIPRLHFEYIEKHGVDEFVEFCEDIVRRERTIIAEKQADKERIDLRTDYKMFKKLN